MTRKRKPVFTASDFLSEQCPLCLSTDTTLYSQDRRRAYLQCEGCSLVFVPKQFHLTPAQEKAEYDLHENDPADEGYRRFLNRCFEPVVERVSDVACGLDFGCGPGPLLAQMFEQSGYSMAIFDPYFSPNEDVLLTSYDFVTCTEVIEHVNRPSDIWPSLVGLLKPYGLLAVMTKRVASQDRFKNWHYKNDQTHICFYSEATFQWVASKFSLTLEVVGDDVVIFHKR